MEWLSNFHMDFWIHREREGEGEGYSFFCVRAQAHRDGYMYMCILFFFLCIMRP